MNILLGISGKPRSGKDTLGKILEEKYGFHRYAFADYLKYLGCDYFGYTKDEMFGPKTAETRAFLQNLGRLLTDMDTNFFVDRIVEKIKADYEKDTADGKSFRAVVTDVRRDDELQLFSPYNTTFVVHDDINDTGVVLSSAFEKLGVVLVERPIEDILASEPGIEVNINHPVESLPDRYTEWDYLISNNEGLKELEANVDQMVKFLGVEDD